MRKLLPLILLFLLLGCSKQNDIPALIPFPKHIEMGTGVFRLNVDTRVVVTEEALAEVAGYLQQTIKKQAGLELTLSGQLLSRNYISLALDSRLEDDEYELGITSKGVSMTGKDTRAILLAIQTLSQLLYLSDDHSPACLRIKDSPEWHYRGMMLDAARHFYTKEEIKSFLDLIALYKFNKFHWHLTDDQGWRIEILKYPELTEKGAWRTFNRHDSACMNLAKKEHNPDCNLPESKLREVDGVVQYGGRYSQADIREVVMYAAERGIDIIPEIDMPGHFSSAIQLFPGLACFNEPSWGALFSSPICPGKDSTLSFCKEIFKEVFELFPYEYVHVGADEVEQSYWKKCPDCRKRIADNQLKDEHELHAWFVREMETFFIENGKKLIGWDEIADGGLSESATMMWWRTWSKQNVAKAIEQGSSVILAPNSHYYFDYKQNSNTLKVLYDFEPVPEGVGNDQLASIKGIQANVWAEYIPSVQRMQYMVFPRLLALSETAWNYRKRAEWDSFRSRLIRQYDILDRLKVNYRPLDLENIEQVNVFIDSTSIKWENPLANIDIRYTLDGSFPDKHSALYTSPISIDSTTAFTIRYFRPDGTAADVLQTTYRKEQYRQGIHIEQPEAGLQLYWHETIARQVADIEQAPVKAMYTVSEIEIPEDVGGKRGLIYSGCLSVPEEDIYTFVLSSDDGSKLYIHNEAVVDNDGPHGPVTVSGQIALQKGWHPIRLYYFDMNNGGMLELRCFNSKKEEVPLQFGHGL